MWHYCNVIVGDSPGDQRQLESNLGFAECEMSLDARMWI